VQLELHQLTLRYERLRKRSPRDERALLVSLSEIGQQLPVVVIEEAPSFILIDGYKRVRALKRLARDTVRATSWQVARPRRCCSSAACAAAARMRSIKPGCSPSCKSAISGRSRSWRGASNAAKAG
jgi:uncharacterized ParB-like nuclease family protein